MSRPTWILRALALAGLAGAMLALAGCGREGSAPLHDGIEAGVDYLRRVQHADGSFAYQVSLDSALTFPPRYNILRHAGAIYALGQYASWSGDTTVAESVARGVDYLRACCLWPVDGADSLLPVWSPPELFNDPDPLEAKLGGAGLGLVALTTLERLRPGSVDPEEMRGVGRFIRYMLKPDGSYSSKYTPSLGGLRDDWTSLYYPGEAALGLVRLAEFDPDGGWDRTALRLLGYLTSSRAGQAEVPPDHWALIATAELLDGPGGLVSDSMRAALMAHGRQVARVMLPGPSGDTPAPDLGTGGRTAPTATRLEGLLALVPLLPANDPLRADILVAAAAAVPFLLACQVVGGPYRGGVRGAHPDEPRAGTAASEIRIDYVQHALSAFIVYDTVTRRGFR